MKKHHGFTLIEIMVVILIIGLMAGTVVVNFVGSNQQDKLGKQARRVQVLVAMASDFAVLNQQQLGLRVNPENSEYLFMRLDDNNQWQPIDSPENFSAFQLPEEYDLELQLDNLPWVDEDSFFDTDLFEDDEGFEIDREIEVGDEPPPPPPPQILLLSSGEITPFSLILKYEPDFSSDAPVYFKVNAEDYAPLLLDGPLEVL
jgi:general secretion pathway protein H